jgi:hypothetical protein
LVGNSDGNGNDTDEGNKIKDGDDGEKHGGSKDGNESEKFDDLDGLYDFGQTYNIFSIAIFDDSLDPIIGGSSNPCGYEENNEICFDIQQELKDSDVEFATLLEFDLEDAD